jgi:hypothetical protein
MYFAASLLIPAVREAYLVIPSLLARRLTLNPVAVFLAPDPLYLDVGRRGHAARGAVLASFKICCEHVEALQPVGVMLGR